MSIRFLKTVAFSGAIAMLSMGVDVSHAQAPSQYPSKPISLIVPATPGGTSDIFARAISQPLQESLGQTILVEYKPGAATNIGSDFVAKAAPDGYTILINGITLATNPAIYPSMPFDPAKDLVPIIEVARMANVITVHPSVPAQSLDELVQLMKKEPGKYNYGSPGMGSSSHLSGELLALKTGAGITHVAYQGNAQATTDHVGGVLQVGFLNLPVALQFVKSGKLRPLAVTSAERSPMLPNVPTVAEALNLPDYELTGWFGLLAPAGTSPAIISRLQHEADLALKDPKVREVITNTGAEVIGGTSAAFAEHIRKDAARLTEVIRKSASTP